jgi:hypothetical protein
MIILVSTISTFILAIGSYVLYKVRERKAQTAKAQRPAVYQAEVVTPIGVSEELHPEQYQPYSEARPVYAQETYSPAQGEVQYGHEPAPASYNPQPRPYTGSRELKQRSRATDENKFLKYTSEGYMPPSSDKKSSTAKWK